MKVLSQLRKVLGIFRFLIDAEEHCRIVRHGYELLQQQQAANELAIAELRKQMTREWKVADEICNSLSKQLADLRAIVANIREESKRAPMQARNAAQLRSFVRMTEEEG